jgi:hypothetical protein
MLCFSIIIFFDLILLISFTSHDQIPSLPRSGASKCFKVLTLICSKIKHDDIGCTFVVAFKSDDVFSLLEMNRTPFFLVESRLGSMKKG